MDAKIVVGIDIGGSTTKIVGFDVSQPSPELIKPIFVKAGDPITSMYGAFGKFLDVNGFSLGDIKKVMVTGAGSSYMSKPIYDLPCEKIAEFKSIGLGGLYLSHFERAIIASCGTGTALVYAERGKEPKYLGGTGVGGGTLVGLSKKLLSMDNVGHVSDLATKSDIALGLINMVFETIGMVAIFAARNYGIRDVVLTGNLSGVEQAEDIFATLNKMFDMNFTIPENSRFGTVIGAALAGI